jgi:hypothetical protein
VSFDRIHWQFCFLKIPSMGKQKKGTVRLKTYSRHQPESRNELCCQKHQLPKLSITISWVFLQNHQLPNVVVVNYLHQMSHTWMMPSFPPLERENDWKWDMGGDPYYVKGRGGGQRSDRKYHIGSLLPPHTLPLPIHCLPKWVLTSFNKLALPRDTS